MPGYSGGEVIGWRQIVNNPNHLVEDILSKNDLGVPTNREKLRERLELMFLGKNRHVENFVEIMASWWNIPNYLGQSCSKLYQLSKVWTSVRSIQRIKKRSVNIVVFLTEVKRAHTLHKHDQDSGPQLPGYLRVCCAQPGKTTKLA